MAPSVQGGLSEKKAMKWGLWGGERGRWLVWMGFVGGGGGRLDGLVVEGEEGGGDGGKWGERGGDEDGEMAWD